MMKKKVKTELPVMNCESCPLRNGDYCSNKAGKRVINGKCNIVKVTIQEEQVVFGTVE